ARHARGRVVLRAQRRDRHPYAPGRIPWDHPPTVLDPMGAERAGRGLEAVTERTGTVDPVETVAPAPDLPAEVRGRVTSRRHERAGFGHALGLALVVGSLVFALVVQTLLFKRWSWTLGDLIYHRGVAYTIAGGDWQGGGPYRGLLSYSGGLYPMLFGAATRVLRVDFDDLLTPASWLATFAWPLAALLLARRVWRGDWLCAGGFVVFRTPA